jgi:hypothetical protein
MSAIILSVTYRGDAKFVGVASISKAMVSCTIHIVTRLDVRLQIYILKR